MKIDIFLTENKTKVEGGGRFYGTIRIADIRRPFTVRYEDLIDEITGRLPALKRQQFIIRF